MDLLTFDSQPFDFATFEVFQGAAPSRGLATFLTSSSRRLDPDPASSTMTTTRLTTKTTTLNPDPGATITTPR